MNAPELQARLLQLFPVFQQLPAAALEEVVRSAAARQAPAGAILFEAASPCTGFPMLLEGSVRVVKSAASGREVQLYRITPGESCLLSSSCLLGHADYTAAGIADELGSVREMVSRLLSSFQDRGWVELGREQIRITDAAALRKLAQL